jgi:hypothetical protein
MSAVVSFGLWAMVANIVVMSFAAGSDSTGQCDNGVVVGDACRYMTALGRSKAISEKVELDVRIRSSATPVLALADRYDRNVCLMGAK